MYALIALGYTMVYGVLEFINFAHSEIFVLGAFVGVEVLFWLQDAGQLAVLHPAFILSLVIAAGMLISGLAAMALERIAYRPLRNAPKLVALISAIGASFFLQYTFRGFFGAGIYAYPDIGVLAGTVPLPFITIKWVDALIVVSALVMMAGLYAFVTRTKTGTAIRAVSEDASTAALMGIDVNRAIVTTFAVGAAMAGAAGVLYGMVFRQITFLSGFLPGVKAFTAAVLGGIGNIPGAMLGGIFLGQAESIGPTLFLSGLQVPSPAQLKDVVAFTMLVMILVLRPSGILGERVSGQRA